MDAAEKPPLALRRYRAPQRVDPAFAAHAPHTAAVVLADGWTRKYPRELAAYPVPGLRENKVCPAVGRADNVHGDRNLFCSCLPVAEG